MSRVAYFVQSHRQPAQVLRLLTLLRDGSPDAALVVGHCPRGEALDEERLSVLGAHHFRHARPARRGYWSLLEPYLDAVALLAARGEDYDWLVYLSGACFPLQPLSAIEAELAASRADGFLSWRPIDDPSFGRRRQGTLRYGYRYRDLPRLRPLLQLLRSLNGVQPWLHVQLTYGPRLGVRAPRERMLGGRRLLRGSQWTTVRRACAERLLGVTREEPALVRFFAESICPDEAFAQTVLAGKPGFTLVNEDRRFVDGGRRRDGHPETLTREDLPRLLASRCHFARKVDPDVDPTLIDLLEAGVRGERTMPEIPR